MLASITYYTLDSIYRFTKAVVVKIWHCCKSPGVAHEGLPQSTERTTLLSSDHAVISVSTAVAGDISNTIILRGLGDSKLSAEVKTEQEKLQSVIIRTKQIYAKVTRKQIAWLIVLGIIEIGSIVAYVERARWDTAINYAVSKVIIICALFFGPIMEGAINTSIKDCYIENDAKALAEQNNMIPAEIPAARVPNSSHIIYAPVVAAVVKQQEKRLETMVAAANEVYAQVSMIVGLPDLGDDVTRLIISYCENDSKKAYRNMLFFDYFKNHKILKTIEGYIDESFLDGEVGRAASTDSEVSTGLSIPATTDPKLASQISSGSVVITSASASAEGVKGIELDEDPPKVITTAIRNEGLPPPRPLSPS